MTLDAKYLYERGINLCRPSCVLERSVVFWQHYVRCWSVAV